MVKKICDKCRHKGANQCFPEYQMEARLMGGSCWYFKEKREPICKECSGVLVNEDYLFCDIPARCNDCSDHITFKMYGEITVEYENKKTKEEEYHDFGENTLIALEDSYEKLYRKVFGE